MADWSKVRLGDVAADITVGFVGSMAAEYEDSGIIFLRSQNIKPHQIDFTDTKFIGADFHRRIAKSALRPGDVVTVRTGKPGTSAVVPVDSSEMNCADLVITRPGPYIDSRWLSYYLNSVTEGFIATQLVGAVQQHFNVGAAKAMELWMPPLEEQKAVAGILGALDDKIAINQAVTSTCENMRANLLKAAIRTGPSTIKRLSEVTSALTRGITPTYTEEQSGVSVLNQKCVRNHVVNTEFGRTTEASRVRPEKVLAVNDTLVNSTGAGTLGRAARWTSEGTSTVDSHITIVRFNPMIVDPAVAGVALLALESEIEAMAEGSTGQTELSRAMLGSLEIELPDRSVQATLGRRIAGLDDVEATYREESRQLARLRDTLLPHLMSGRLLVNDAEKQVEEVL